jgi:hypothetical protein
MISTKLGGMLKENQERYKKPILLAKLISPQIENNSLAKKGF